MAALNGNNPNSIYTKIATPYFLLAEINSVLGFLAFAITVFIPVVLGKIILVHRWIL
jgi:hypothetical protein